MGKRQVYYDIKNGVMTITIDNPEMKNGLTYQGTEEFAECYEILNKDDSIKVAVIRGNDKYFWTGGRVDPNAPGENEKYANAIEHFEAARKENKKPIIAAITGDCLKAGMALLCSSDVAIARKGVKFGLPEVRMGGVPMLVMVETMDYFPKKFAIEAYLTSWEYSAEDMYRLGLLNCIVEPEDFEATLQKYIDVYIKTPEILVTLTRKAYNELSKLSGEEERTKFGMDMLRNEVLPAMQTVKQQYNV